MPFFSVVIPTFNRAHIILPTINSVLNQTYCDFEVLIIDDGSTDNTSEVIKESYGNENRVKYFFKENGERGAARNFGIMQAEGEYVFFLDSDDLWLPNHLSEMKKAVNSNVEVNFIASKYNWQKNDKLSPSDLNKYKEGFHSIEIVLRGNPFSCNFGVRKCNKKLKLFREEREFVIIEDWVFLVENLFQDKIYLSEANTVILVDHPSRSMRQNNQNIINKRLHALDWLLSNYEFKPVDTNVLKSFSYYFCSVHYYLDNNRMQGLKALKKAITHSGLSIQFTLLLLKLLLGQDIVKKLVS